MRRLFCCAAALVAAGLVGVYGGADFVSRYPNSTAVRLGQTACSVASDTSMIAGAAAKRCRHLFGKSEAPPPPMDHALVAPDEPTPMAPVAKPEAHDDVPLWVRGVEEAPAEQPAVKDEEPQAEPPHCPWHHCPDSSCPNTSPAAHDDDHKSDAEECEPSFIPPIGDDDKAPEPAVKPETNGPVCPDSGLMSWIFGSILGEFTERMIHEAAQEPAGSEEQSRPGTPPRCQEDPDYPQQYPGCPHLGNCPAGKKAPKNEMPKSDDPNGQSAAPAKGANADCRAHPVIDTTEFRPSDARDGEFGRIPF
jgi:hypothetical protein